MTSRYPNNSQFDHSNGKCYFFLVEDGDAKKLFLVAKSTVRLSATDGEYLLGHGAGTWLQANKAIQWFGDHPEKSFVVDWTTDAVLCVQDQNGRDGPVKTLRAIMHDLEKSGHASFEVAGHKVDRPPGVINGTESDRRCGTPNQSRVMH